MKFCTKCGNELKDDDMFCARCGAKATNEEPRQFGVEDIYSNNYADKKAYSSNTVGKIGFILSIIGLVLFNALMFMIGFGDDTFPATLFVLLYLLLLSLTGASLGTAIPGFVISRKRVANKKIAVAGFVLALILATCMIFLYVILPTE